MEDKEKMNNKSIQRKVVQRSEVGDATDAASDTQDEIESGVEDIDAGVEGAKEGAENVENKIDEGKDAVEDGQKALEEAKNADVQGQIKKLSMGDKYVGPPLIVLPFITVSP